MWKSPQQNGSEHLQPMNRCQELSVSFIIKDMEMMRMHYKPATAPRGVHLQIKILSFSSTPVLTTVLECILAAGCYRLVNNSLLLYDMRRQYCGIHKQQACLRVSVQGLIWRFLHCPTEQNVHVPREGVRAPGGLRSAPPHAVSQRGEDEDDHAAQWGHKDVLCTMYPQHYLTVTCTLSIFLTDCFVKMHKKNIFAVDVTHVFYSVH